MAEPGRPKINPEKLRTKKVVFTVNEEEKNKLDQMAYSSSLTLGALIRELALDRAEKFADEES